jgi:UDP-glucuronate decarboxylase
MTGSRSPIIRRPLPVDDPTQRCPDITQAQSLLGWRPTTLLKDGLARTIEYFDKLLAQGRELEPGATA